MHEWSLVSGIYFSEFVWFPNGTPALPASDHGDAKALLSFGGWITVSNIVSPLLVYVDRFVIWSFISMEAVAWYARLMKW